MSPIEKILQNFIMENKKVKTTPFFFSNLSFLFSSEPKFDIFSIWLEVLICCEKFSSGFFD
jgi:hypothetical protein